MSIKLSRFALYAAVALTLACGTTVGVSSDSTAEAASSGETIPLPDFTLTDSNGQEFTKASIEGQVVLLNFWATWCGPCKIEMPWFIDFQRKYKDKGFTVLAVSLDEDGWDVVRPFAEELKANFPILLGDDEMAEEFGGVVALPTTFIINKKGEIVTRHTGLVSKDEYESEIERLL